MDLAPPPLVQHLPRHLPQHVHRSTGRLLARSRGGGLGGVGLLLVLLLLLPLAACSGGGGGGGSSESGASADADTAADTGSGGGDAAEAPAPEQADAGAVEQSGSAGRTSPMQRAVVSTGEVSLRSDDVPRDRAEVLRLARTWGGLVTEEQTGASSGDDEGFASLVVRVPSERFDEAMEAVAGVGTLVDQSRSSEDVTTQVVDVAARVRAQERSVRRIEALLSEATSLRDVVSIEGDLAGRQAELDSLKSQRAYLDDQTSLSTISVSISGTEREPEPQDDSGFLGGLRTGWGALGASAAVVLTAAGAVLPFAVVAALVAVPVVAVRRRRARPVPGDPAV